MRIFVSVGTHEAGYPRLLTAMRTARSRLPELEIYYQFGSDAQLQEDESGAPFLNPTQMAEKFAWADVVVAQASPGIFSAAAQAGCFSIVMPRRAVHGEAVDDHQLQFADYLVSKELAHAVHDGQELVSALVDLLTTPSADRARTLSSHAKSARERRVDFQERISRAFTPSSLEKHGSQGFVRRRIPRWSNCAW